MINSLIEDEKQLEEAAELLKEQKKVIQAYVMDEIFDKMGAGEALLAGVWRETFLSDD